MPQTGNIPAHEPDLTLGHHILAWAERYIVQPDGEFAGQAWRFTDEQKHFIKWLYALNPDGTWVYSEATLRRAKGFGKTPLLASLAIIEFIGPCRWSGIVKTAKDGTKIPVGRPVHLPLVQLAATSLDQTAQTMDMIRGMLSESPAERQYDIDISKTMIQFRGNRPGKITPVTSSTRGNEGARPTMVVCDESHHWVDSTGGPKFYKTLQRNTNKTLSQGSRCIQTTNAYDPNEESVAQSTHDAVLNGNPFILYDCREADPNIDLKDPDAVRAGLVEAYGDSWWAPIDQLVNVIVYGTNAAHDYRFYLNNIAESADTWMSKAEWEACYTDDDPVLPGDQISIGFDGSLFNDATGAVGCRLRDGRLFTLGVWEKPENAGPDWEVDVLAVEAVIQQAFTTYQVEWMYADPPYWQEAIGRWSLAYGDDKVFEYWTSKSSRMVNAIERFRTAATTRDLSHSDRSKLTRHVLNAVAREVPQGTLIRKDSPKSKRKIDLAVAAVLAFEGRADAIADGRLNRRRRRVVGFG
ncbi:phage terminase family protein [Streptomyces rimosus]|uniref:phage terminase family protein n=1 Tax=Streptomyces rimosus TaxID=1927 RepID=UPI001F1DB4DC|nr:phage terminase family protein [Streptomyces rimosus]